MYGVFKEIFQLQEHVLSLKCMAYTLFLRSYLRKVTAKGKAKPKAEPKEELTVEFSGALCIKPELAMFC